MKSFADYRELEEVELDEDFKKGDFVKDSSGKIHRVFGVVGNTLSTGEYRGNNGYGGTASLHKTKATKVPTPKDVKDNLDEALDKGEYDYEGQMARTQLQTTMRNCKDMIAMITDDDNMPEWVQSKITLAQDYITSARDYLQSKQELGESVELDENFADGKNPQDKGDSKRLGVPTKSSVSTLRKVAKEGGRKGQLAHWMANMKSGKAKMKEGVDRGEVVEETTPPSLRNPAKHRILITYSDPQHPSVSMRKEKQQKHLRVPATKKDGTTVYQGEAEDLAKRYMKKQGYKVHDTAHAGLVKEDAE